jgi:adenine-specific DNA-methyltransferase
MVRRRDIAESRNIISDILAKEGLPESFSSELERVSSLLDGPHSLGLQWENQPESRLLWGLSIERGTLVKHAHQGEPSNPTTVDEIVDGIAHLADGLTVPVCDLVRVALSGTATFPTVSELVYSHHPEAEVVHRIMESDNLDSLHLLGVFERGTFDVIYIDPPYGSGSTEWTYNNRFVNPDHRYKSSMWLSMMHGRLELAKRLLKRDGVLIIAIDDFHHHRLRALLDRQWRGWTQRNFTIRHHPQGGKDDEWQKVHEYAIVLTRDEKKAKKLHQPKTKTSFNWKMSYTRSGEGDMNERSGRPRSCGALLIDTKILEKSEEKFCTDAVVGIEPPYPFDEALREKWEAKGLEFSLPVVPLGGLRELQHTKNDEGLLRVFPIGSSGVENCARRSYERVRNDIESSVADYAVNSNLSCFLKSQSKGTTEPRSIWGEVQSASLERQGGRFSATSHGTNLLKKHFFAGESRFSYAKSLYTVYDLIEMASWRKADAKILDFFAGSGTTLHATMLLNKVYPGSRQCTLVLNTEMFEKEAKELWKAGIRPWSKEWAEASNSRRACWKRNLLAAEGIDIKGDRLNFNYDVFRLDDLSADFEAGEGFNDGIEFYQIGFLEPEEVVLGDFSFSDGMMDFLAGGSGVPRHIIHSSNDIEKDQSDSLIIVTSGDPDVLMLVQKRWPNRKIRSFIEYRQRLQARRITEDLFGCE